MMDAVEVSEGGSTDPFSNTTTPIRFMYSTHRPPPGSSCKKLMHEFTRGKFVVLWQTHISHGSHLYDHQPASFGSACVLGSMVSRKISRLILRSSSFNSMEIGPSKDPSPCQRQPLGRATMKPCRSLASRPSRRIDEQAVREGGLMSD